jgi:hypothetical protein
MQWNSQKHFQALPAVTTTLFYEVWTNQLEMTWLEWNDLYQDKELPKNYTATA